MRQANWIPAGRRPRAPIAGAAGAIGRAAACVVVVLAAGAGQAQVRQTQRGRALDANYQRYTRGENEGAGNDAATVAELYVNRQVTGLHGFGGRRAFRASDELRINLPSARLDTFRRQSAGVADVLGGGSWRPRPFKSRTATVLSGADLTAPSPRGPDPDRNLVRLLAVPSANRLAPMPEAERKLMTLEYDGLEVLRPRSILDLERALEARRMYDLETGRAAPRAYVLDPFDTLTDETHPGLMNGLRSFRVGTTVRELETEARREEPLAYDPTRGKMSLRRRDRWLTGSMAEAADEGRTGRAPLNVWDPQPPAPTPSRWVPASAAEAAPSLLPATMLPNTKASRGYYLAEADASLQTGRYYEAARLYGLASTTGRDAAAAVGRSVALLHAGESYGAAVALRNALRAEPKLLTSGRLPAGSMGQLFHQRLDELSRRLTRAGVLGADPTTALLAGYLYYQAGKKELARQYAQLLLTAARGDPQLRAHAQALLEATKPAAVPLPTLDRNRSEPAEAPSEGTR